MLETKRVSVLEIFYDFVVKQRDDERYENRDKDRRDRDKFYLGVAYLFWDYEKIQLALMQKVALKKYPSTKFQRDKCKIRRLDA